MRMSINTPPWTSAHPSACAPSQRRSRPPPFSLPFPPSIMRRKKKLLPTIHPSAREASWTGRLPRRRRPPPPPPSVGVPHHSRPVPPPRPNLDRPRTRLAALVVARPRHARSARRAITAQRPFHACRTPSATSRRPARRTRTRWACSVPSAAPCCRGSTPRSGIGAGTKTRVARPQSGPSAREVVPSPPSTGPPPSPPHTPSNFGDG